MFEMKNQKILISSLVVMLLFTLVITPIHGQTTGEGFSWQVIYLSDKTGCNVSEDRKVKDISGIIDKYFSMYKINNQRFGTTCLYSGEYFENSFSDNVDLNILVFDERIGQKLFQKYGYNGLYAHFGSDRMNNHVIMITIPPQFSSAYDNVEFPWSLSEKLSQFILSYYGYNSESITRMLDFKSDYDACVKRVVADECDKMISIIRSDISGEGYSVLSPVKEIVNQKSLKYLPDDLYSSQVVKDILRNITNWWIKGVIDDQMYLELVQQIVDVPIKNNNEIKTTQLLISNGFVIVSEEKNNSIKQKDDKIKIIQEDDEFYTVLNYVPFDANKMELEPETSEIPIWFKNRALIWQDGKLVDKIFFDGLTALIQNGFIEN
ncbi:hypothetical protein NZNM25_02750 [Nitrosopumilus zosterae]|uniref:Uncharacterized protein n=2 Tax=Nitrosopumilus zosterae TaxID=718286 RepID=A0A2S2KPG0_9ARCH|nr:hypothetical protein NZNM25_02750 [Nitrosopumilus zosterae]